MLVLLLQKRRNSHDDQQHRCALPVMDGVAPDSAGATDLRRSLLANALVSCLLVAAFADDAPSANPMSRLATMDALVHDGTFAIGGSPYVATIDKVKIGKRLYSSKPPVLSTLAAAAYGLIHAATDMSFRENAATAARVMALVVGGISHVLLLAYAFVFIRRLAPSQAWAWSFACFAFGHLGVAYATTVNNHMPAAVALFAAFYYAFRIRHSTPRVRHFMYAGALAGLAPTIDLGVLFVSVAIAVYLLTFDAIRTLRWFAPAALPPLLFHFFLTWGISGSLRPIATRPDLYLYEGSYWSAPAGLDALNEPSWVYLYNMMIGHHGLLSMTPVLLLAFGTIASVVWRRGPYWQEALVIAIPFAMMVAFYTATTKNYGGACAGFRWLLPIVPLLLLFVTRWLATPRSAPAMALFVLLSSIGQFHAFDALRGPWQPSSWERLLSSQ